MLGPRSPAGERLRARAPRLPSPHALGTVFAVSGGRWRAAAGCAVAASPTGLARLPSLRARAFRQGSAETPLIWVIFFVASRVQGISLVAQRAGRTRKPGVSIPDEPNPPASPSSLCASLPDTGLECPVCKEDYTVAEQVRQLPCNHFFHSNCIVPWLELVRARGRRTGGSARRPPPRLRAKPDGAKPVRAAFP